MTLFNILAEEIVQILAAKKFAAGMELLEMRHLIGSAIVASELYKKNADGQGELIVKISDAVGLGERSVHYCI